MSSDNEDKSLDPLALLRKSRAALAAEQADGPSPATTDDRSGDGGGLAPGPRSKKPKAAEDRPSNGADTGTGHTYMYRGRPVTRGRSAPSGGAMTAKQGGRGGRKRNPKGSFRGASVDRTSSRNPSKAGGEVDLKQALRKLAHLERDGLISRAEYEAKRREILDRI